MEDKAASGPRKGCGNPKDTGEPGDYTRLVVQVSRGVSLPAVFRVMSTDLDWFSSAGGQGPNVPRGMSTHFDWSVQQKDGVPGLLGWWGQELTPEPPLVSIWLCEVLEQPPPHQVSCPHKFPSAPMLPSAGYYLHKKENIFQLKSDLNFL